MFNFKLIFGNKYHKDQRGLEDMRDEPAPADAEQDPCDECCPASSKKENTCSKE